jgi:hypothetical protein
LKQEAKRKQKITKKKSNNSHKRDMFENDDLKEPNKMIHRFLMPFTRVPTQLDRKEESSGLIPNSQQQKNSK